MTMKEYHFETEMEVRDYECDIQGIVNNSVYLNYFEHCRHKFSQNAGLDFTQMHYEGVDAVVIRAELDFKFPLKPGDLLGPPENIKKGTAASYFRSADYSQDRQQTDDRRTNHSCHHKKREAYIYSNSG